MITRLLPWCKTTYETGLEEQERLTREGKTGWVLFCCPPTIPIGKRAGTDHVLIPEKELIARGIRVINVDRGGQVTYHGPGQIIGFPVGTLERLTGDSRAVKPFVNGLERRLAEFIGEELSMVGRKPEIVTGDEATGAGIWLVEGGIRRKVVSIGMRFSREAIRHGFAINVEPLAEAFSLIVPCGQQGAAAGSLRQTAGTARDLDATLGRLEKSLTRPL